MHSALKLVYADNPGTMIGSKHYGRRAFLHYGDLSRSDILLKYGFFTAKYIFEDKSLPSSPVTFDDTFPAVYSPRPDHMAEIHCIFSNLTIDFII